MLQDPIGVQAALPEMIHTGVQAIADTSFDPA